MFFRIRVWTDMLFRIRVCGLICCFVYTCVWTDMLLRIRVCGLICCYVYVCVD